MTTTVDRLTVEEAKERLSGRPDLTLQSLQEKFGSRFLKTDVETGQTYVDSLNFGKALAWLNTQHNQNVVFDPMKRVADIQFGHLPGRNPLEPGFDPAKRPIK